MDYTKDGGGATGGAKLDCPTQLNMARITKPRALSYDAPKAEDAGVSGFLIITKNRISFHIFHRFFNNLGAITLTST